MGKIKLKKVQCKRCFYTWTPRTEDVRTCANLLCRSIYWDKPRKNRTVTDFNEARNYAISRVNEAIRTGKLKKLSQENVECVDCGGRALNYEHRDYSKPLDVEPVCVKCNKERGKANFKAFTVKSSDLVENNCKLCNYQWLPKNNKKPKACPNCKRYDWKKE